MKAKTKLDLERAWCADQQWGCDHSPACAHSLVSHKQPKQAHDRKNTLAQLHT